MYQGIADNHNKFYLSRQHMLQI